MEYELGRKTKERRGDLSLGGPGERKTAPRGGVEKRELGVCCQKESTAKKTRQASPGSGGSDKALFRGDQRQKTQRDEKRKMRKREGTASSKK